MRVAIYARVSTSQQSCDLQLEALREFAAARRFEIVAEYIDSGISGAISERPQLTELMADARKRKFDAVLVYKLDRFGRSLAHLISALEKLNEVGCTFISYSENLDFSTSSGRLMFQIIGAMAEFERSLIRERVQAGVHRAISNGKHWGRRPAEIDLSKLPPGTSIRKASAMLGVNRESIRRAMRRAATPAS